MKKTYQLEEIPVVGGRYAVARWGNRPGDAILALHGITASHKEWPPVVDRLTTDRMVLAPDLRGRGGSSGLPGPFGLAAHVRDVEAVLDHHRVERAWVVGHSLGAYLALEFANTLPGRVAGLLLVDGGLSLPLPPGVDPAVLLKAVLGPALARLTQTFASREEYRSFWRAHPAMQEIGAWGDYLDEYADYDLAGSAPELRSRVNVEAVRVDGLAPLEAGMASVIDRIEVPMVLLTAPRGLLNQPEPLLPKALVEATRARLPGLQCREVADTNHYTIVLGLGAATVAAEIDRIVAG